MRKNVFSSYHPLVEVMYFSLVIGVAMITVHPVYLLASMLGSVCFFAFISKKDELKGVIKVSVLILVFSVLINSLFSHGGVSILFYLPSGNPVTLESIFYGFSAGATISSSLMWFMCLYKTVDSDKLLYLFSRFSPTFALLVSMIIRFIPEFKMKYEEAYQVQRLLSGKGKNSKIRISVKCFISVFSQSIENSLETADSMKSRGYGLGKRTSFRKYDFEVRDKYVAAFIVYCAFVIVSAGAAGYIYFRYYPSIKGSFFKPITVYSIAVYLMICFLPVCLQVKEEHQWKKSESKI